MFFLIISFSPLFEYPYHASILKSKSKNNEIMIKTIINDCFKKLKLFEININYILK